MSKIRLDKFIADTSSLSRKDAAKAVRNGNITVNEKAVTDISFKVDIDVDTVALYGEQLLYKEHYYIMMNKPQGYLSATEDKYDKTVLDLLDSKLPKTKIFPAGRLDKDTEGFLFLTSDGPMAHRITGPKNHVPKKYFVTVDLPLKDSFIELFKDGITLETGEECKSADLEIIDDFNCYLTITEGKYHQVKRMFLTFGLTVTYLKRVQIGNLKLDNTLDLGEYRELTADEVVKICLKK